MSRPRLSRALALFCAGGLLIAQETGEAVFARAEKLSERNDSNGRAALPLFLDARRLFASEKNPRREADTLLEIGVIHLKAGEAPEALEYLDRARAIFHGLPNGELSEALTLYYVGASYDTLNRFDQAAKVYLQALDRYREKPSDSAGTLLNLGLDYRRLSEYEKSIEYSRQAASLFHAAGDTFSEAKAFNNLGGAYASLHDYTNSAAYFTKALAAVRQTGGDAKGETILLSNIASSYESLHNLPKALEMFRQSLALAQKSKLRAEEGRTVANLGHLSNTLGDFRGAAKYLQHAIAISQEVRDRESEALALTNLGIAEVGLGRPAEAIADHERALVILREIKSRAGEAKALSNLMDAWAADGQPRVAALYGKQSVNLYQEIRTGLAGLSQSLQKSYAGGNERTYRRLADLLIAQGRLGEAERTLHLLKDEEFFAFVRGDNSGAGPSARVELTPEEAEWSRKVDDRRVAIATRRGELMAKASLTAAEQKQMDGYDALLMPGNAEFQRYLAGLTNQSAPARVREIGDAEGLMLTLRELPAGTVAIYTLSAEDKYRAILITPDVQKAYEYPINAADLNRKVLAFRAAIETPQADPRPRAKQLFDILIGPKLLDDLHQAKARTIMWSLDGTLHYVPLAALYDGRRYLIEQFRIEVFTPASSTRLKDQPGRQWTSAEFGVTKAHGVFAPLPEVAKELDGVSGILPGEVLLDERFTLDSMLSAMRRHYQVIHIASHFSFEPGNEINSFLLLGDGAHLTLAGLKAFPQTGGLDLLTLSACNTGMGGLGADGTEVEGLGVIAQRRGAKAVLASLWEVSDESTSLLMQSFYRLRQSDLAVTKAEALRQAQLAMLRGQLKPSSGRPASRGIQASWKFAGQTDLPRFPQSADAPFAHPYYWASFFLMGNWL